MRIDRLKLMIAGMLVAFLSVGTVACGGGEEERVPDGEEETVTEEPEVAESAEVVMYQYKFNPNQITVPQGTEVVFTNKDPDRHNVTIAALNIDENVPAGESFSHVFDTTGEFAVDNRFASSPMQMEIVVE